MLLGQGDPITFWSNHRKIIVSATDNSHAFINGLSLTNGCDLSCRFPAKVAHGVYVVLVSHLLFASISCPAKLAEPQHHTIEKQAAGIT